jgi:hypothetical protein
MAGEGIHARSTPTTQDETDYVEHGCFLFSGVRRGASLIGAAALVMGLLLVSQKVYPSARGFAFLFPLLVGQVCNLPGEEGKLKTCPTSSRSGDLAEEDDCVGRPGPKGPILALPTSRSAGAIG